MIKSQKEYAAARIRQILTEKLIQCACKAPDLLDHLQAAAVDGELQLLPSATIKKEAKQIVVTTGSNHYLKIGFCELFKKPKSYINAETAHLIESEQIKEANAQREAFAQAIIDRVMLDEFENGEDAIAEMLSSFLN